MSVKRIIKLDCGNGNSISIEIEKGLDKAAVTITEGYRVISEFYVKNEDLLDFANAIKDVLDADFDE